MDLYEAPLPAQVCQGVLLWQSDGCGVVFLGLVLRASKSSHNPPPVIWSPGTLKSSTGLWTRGNQALPERWFLPFCPCGNGSRWEAGRAPPVPSGNVPNGTIPERQTDATGLSGRPASLIQAGSSISDTCQAGIGTGLWVLL